MTCRGLASAPQSLTEPPPSFSKHANLPGHLKKAAFQDSDRVKMTDAYEREQYVLTSLELLPLP